MRRLFAVLLAALALAGCSRLVETDQARLCRMALPAVSPPDSTIEVLSQHEFPDGRGLRVVYRLGPAVPGFDPFRRLPLPPARTAAALRRNDRAGDRRPAAQRRQPLFPRALLAGDAGSARRRPGAARRRRRIAAPAALRRLRVAAGAQRPAAGGDLRAAGGRLFAGLRPRRPHQSRLRRLRRRRRLCGGARRPARRRPDAGDDPRHRAGARRRGGGDVGDRDQPLGLPSAARRYRPAGAGGERRPGDGHRRVSAPRAGQPAGLGEPDAQRAVRRRARRRLRRHLRRSTRCFPAASRSSPA